MDASAGNEETSEMKTLKILLEKQGEEIKELKTKLENQYKQFDQVTECICNLQSKYSALAGEDHEEVYWDDNLSVDVLNRRVKKLEKVVGIAK